MIGNKSGFGVPYLCSHSHKIYVHSYLCLEMTPELWKELNNKKGSWSYPVIDEPQIKEILIKHFPEVYI